MDLRKFLRINQYIIQVITKIYFRFSKYIFNVYLDNCMPKNYLEIYKCLRKKTKLHYPDTLCGDISQYHLQFEMQARTEVDPGDDVLSMRILDSSRHQYSSILRRFFVWLQSNDPSCVADGKILLPLSTRVCKLFLAYSSIKRDKFGAPLTPNKNNGFSTINGIKSSIKHLYKEENITMENDLIVMMTGK